MSLPSASKDVSSIDLLQINYSGKVAHAIQNLSFQPTNKSMHSNHLDTCSQHWNKMTLIVNLETF
jgi:hypothetical protein